MEKNPNSEPLAGEQLAQAPASEDEFNLASSPTSTVDVTEKVVETPSTQQLAPLDTPGSDQALVPCSPLSEHGLADLAEIVSASYTPPVSHPEGRHHGVDFSYYRQGERESIHGEGVQAVFPGFVAASVNDRFPYGNLVILETPLERLPDDILEVIAGGAYGSLYHLYAHLDAPPLLTLGEQVDACQLLGAVGKSGNAGVAHLHLEMRLGPAGVRFESLAYYSTQTGEAERLAYERWRTGGEFIHFDPMLVLAH